MNICNICFILNEMGNNVRMKIKQKALRFSGEMRKFEAVILKSEWLA